MPAMVRWPDRVPAGRTSDAIVSTLDVLPTFAALAEASHRVPTDRLIDGVDQTELLLGESIQGARDRFLYFEKEELQAVREGPWKLRLPDLKELRTWTESDHGTNEIELYHLERDLGESKNVANGNPEVVQRLLALAESAKVRRAERSASK